MIVSSLKTAGTKTASKMNLGDLFDYYSADGYKWSSESTACDLPTWINEYMLGSTEKWLKSFLTEDIAGSFEDETSDIANWDLKEAVSYLDSRLDAFAYAEGLTLETTVHDLFSNDGVTLTDLYVDLAVRFYTVPLSAY